MAMNQNRRKNDLEVSSAYKVATYTHVQQQQLLQQKKSYPTFAKWIDRRMVIKHRNSLTILYTAKTLGLLQPHLHQCDQEMLQIGFLKVHWEAFSHLLVFSAQKIYLATILRFLNNHATKELSKQQTSPDF